MPEVEHVVIGCVANKTNPLGLRHWLVHFTVFVIGSTWTCSTWLHVLGLEGNCWHSINEAKLAIRVSPVYSALSCGKAGLTCGVLSC
jgi:hypothetical protein